MDDVALGVKVFTRADKLEQLLASVDDTDIDTVYVADDGETTNRKESIYAAEYDFNLTVLDLEHDAGLGYGRKRIVEESNEKYLLIVDSDHEVPENVGQLRKQLEADDQLGGVSGLFFERNHLRGACHDLREDGDIIVKTVASEKDLRFPAGYPLIEFDFIPNVVMYRRACLEDYVWDPNYVIGYEHLDFYVGHMKQTDWKFGVNPGVLFPHHPGGDSGYLSNRQSAKLTESKEHFTDKWGYSKQMTLDAFPQQYNKPIATFYQVLPSRIPAPIRLRIAKFVSNSRDAIKQRLR